ncbi:signal peptidase I [Borreliella yangtzensis]|uniref:signal peptidase I n=1 Tax=Borreliella yangtzensis TaxID=683292 RepID=UPI0026480ECC|nr:signal peptidase I [Borreliella yangtzensis]WKC74875.1 signal peptidase I [Borreliella yangtzensis]
MHLRKLDKFASFLVFFVEKYLTYRKRKKYFCKLRAKKRGFFLNFLYDFVAAAIFVLVINQYFIQAYKIPSGSMENTLQIGDFLFVDKFFYGPELLPGLFKINGFKTPEESDIIIFENPEYKSKGVFFDIFQRILYMLTLSFIDIDRDEYGNPNVRFLVKRGVFTDGKIVKFNNGKAYVKKEGEENFILEDSYRDLVGQNFSIKKIVANEDYGIYGDFAMFVALSQLNINLSSTPDFSFFDVRVIDRFELERLEYKYLSAFMPYVDYYIEKAIIRDYGIYVPYGYVLPIGDNRDNSHDGRFFGVINKNKVLGRTLVIYLPFSRIGFI